MELNLLSSNLSTLMKNLIQLLLFALPAFDLQAQLYEGPLNGSSFTTIVIPGSNRTWVNPGTASASDNVYSTFGNITGASGSYTDYLVATNFGFTISTAAIVTGIVVEMERSDPNFRTADYRIRIVKGGTIGHTERAAGATYPSSDSYQSYGHTGDLWGETWSIADINAANFGVAIAARRTFASGSTAGRVDHIRITVFYTFPVPLQLINFSASKTDHSAVITWTTAEEINMSHYEVERSSNARDFTSIKSVASLNQTRDTKYTINDNSPARGISYYRLKTVGNDGEVKYSKIISLQFGTGNTVTVYPTTWKSGTTLHITNPEYEKLRISFFNTSGQLAGKAVTNSNEVPTNMISTAKGILFFRIVNEAGSIVGLGKLVANYLIEIEN